MLSAGFKRALIFLALVGVLYFSCHAQKLAAYKPSDFLFPEFSSAEVKFKGGAVQNARMNYNVLKELMVFEQKGELMDVVETKTIDTIILKGLRFIPHDDFFLEVIPGSEIPLFVQHRGQVKSAGKEAGYGTKSETSAVSGMAALENAGKQSALPGEEAYVVKTTDVYWIKAYGVMQRFLNEKQFARIFRHRQEDVLKYIKDNSIDIRNRQDVIKLLRYCNEI